MEASTTSASTLLALTGDYFNQYLPVNVAKMHWHNYFKECYSNNRTMNLIFDPTITALRCLVNTASLDLPAHNIVIDYDGEVIIDPEIKFADVELNRYKHRIEIKSGNTTRHLKVLLKKLVAGFYKDTRAIFPTKGQKIAA